MAIAIKALALIKMDEAERLNFLIDKLGSEKDTPPEKAAERLELLKAAEMLENMLDMHMDEDTEKEAETRFEISGGRRNYGKERGNIIKFMDSLTERLDRYFSRK